MRYRLWGSGSLATAVVALVVHRMATPIPGMGISVPTLAPPLLAAIVALVISWRFAAPVAYIGGSLGVLVGADLLESQPAARPWRPSRVDRRRRDFRWDIPDRRHRGAFGEFC